MYKIERPDTIKNDRLKVITAYEITDTKAISTCFRKLLALDRIPRKKAPDIISDIMTVDIETTTVPIETEWNKTEYPYAVPYLYQVFLCGYVFIFRYDNEFELFISQLSGALQDSNCQLVCYIHNLSFEYQFFRSRIGFDGNKVFAMSNRRIAKAENRDNTIIFRCSYLLSNMSLEKFTQNYNSEKFRKDKELIDYEILRFPWTELDNDVLYYSAMDVITLYHAVKNLMKLENDNLVTIPMTNTGYVRRSYKKACYGDMKTHHITKENKNERELAINYRKMMKACMPTFEQYTLMVQAFRGGNTHANRHYSGLILEDVDSFDFSSSYPAVMIGCDEFPMGKLANCTNDMQDKKMFDFILDRYWVLMLLEITDIHLRNPDKTPCPYISKSNLVGNITGGEYDNGRVMTQPGTVRYAILGMEWDIIRKQYDFEYKVIEAYYSPKGYLPNPIRQTCANWFKLKTELKGVEGAEYEYMKSKNRVNSSYGMMVERIIKEINEVDNFGNIFTRKPTIEQAKEQLEEYIKPKNNKFLLYQWGITVTTLARKRHMQVIDMFTESFDTIDFAYGDTDSCKVVNAERYLPLIDVYNKAWVDYTSKCGIPMSAITKKGEKQYLGWLDWEKTHHADLFKTLGAKKYACQNKNGELEITIAGVPKEAGAKMLGNIYNFIPGFIFKTEDEDELKDRQNWKKLLTYRDDICEEMEIEGHKIMVKTCIAMTRTEYKLKLTNEYENLIDYHDKYIEYKEFEDVWQ